VFQKRGTTVVELEAAYPSDWEENIAAIFAVSYTSAHRQARTITNDKENDPAVNCDFGWIDAREFNPPQSHQDSEAFVNVTGVLLYSRLLSPKECGDLLKISFDESDLFAQDPRIGPFPP
jgi:hypothetical protein